MDRTRFETYCDGPPVAQLTDGVGQDESGEPEDCQQLWEEEEQNKTGHRSRERITVTARDLLAVKGLQRCQRRRRGSRSAELLSPAAAESHR